MHQSMFVNSIFTNISTQVELEDTLRDYFSATGTFNVCGLCSRPCDYFLATFLLGLASTEICNGK